MKITRMRHSGAQSNEQKLRDELNEVTVKLEKAIQALEFHRQFQDHNLTCMWMEEVQHLSNTARDLLKRLGL